MKYHQMTCAVLVAMATSCSYLSSGVKIVFRNDSSLTLPTVEIKYSGGSYIATNVASHSIVKTTVYAAGDSGMEVIVLADTRRVSKHLPVYFEGGSRGIVRISFGEGGIINEKASIVP